jgi:4-amino-4-deoxy-L-arabinose transferase-like glycosyltransferase
MCHTCCILLKIFIAHNKFSLLLCHATVAKATMEVALLRVSFFLVFSLCFIQHQAVSLEQEVIVSTIISFEVSLTLLLLKHSHKNSFDESDDSCIISAAHLDHRFLKNYISASLHLYYFLLNFAKLWRVTSLAASSTTLERAIEHIGSLESAMRRRAGMFVSGVKPGQSWPSTPEDTEMANWKPEPKCNENFAPVLENCEIAKNQVKFCDYVYILKRI